MEVSESVTLNERAHRYPFCIVWTPIPVDISVCGTYGNMYIVSEDNMGFGWPTSVLQMKPSKVSGGIRSWDSAVADASEEYKQHVCAMVRLSVELINDAYQFVNAVNQRELSLRNLQIPAFENLGTTRDQFDVIDLTDNNIRKIENLPLLLRLDTLLLHNNSIQQIQDDIGEKLPNLKTLALTNNNIDDLAHLDPLAQCSKLEYLSLMGNPVSHKPQYRAYVINKLRSLRVLDFRRIKEAERTDAHKLFKKKKKMTEKDGKERAEANGILVDSNKDVEMQPVDDHKI